MGRGSVIEQTITRLEAEREHHTRQITRIEELVAGLRAHLAVEPPAINGHRRGRKSMGEVERQEVSQRMKRYWAKRRKAGT